MTPLRTALATTTLAILTVSSAAGQTVIVTTPMDEVDIPTNATIDDLPGPDGLVSFREALRVSDNTAGHQTVGFEIPEERWYLPDIFPGQVVLQGDFSFSVAQPVTIDGTTQTAFTGDTFPGGNEVYLPLQTYFNGDGSVVFGVHDCRIEFSGSNNEIYGNTGGMFIALYFGADSIVHDNEAQTININWGHDNVIVRNTTQRVRITGGGSFGPATGNRVGGPDVADRNYITGFGNWDNEPPFTPAGTTVELYGSENTLIQNNYIGTTPDGMAIGNRASTAGIGIFTGNFDLTIRDNLIAISATTATGGGHYGSPIYMDCFEDGGSIFIYGNTLGLNAEGDPLLGGLHGVWVSPDTLEFVTNVHIGGSDTGQGNVIAGHWSTGVLMYNSPGIEPTSGIRVSGNSIYGNGDLGIDLMPNTWDFGPTANDPLDADFGANGLQNFPEIAGASADSSSVHIVGELPSEPMRDYTLEFFASPVGHASGFGEGQVFLGFVTVRTDAQGVAPFDVAFPVSLPDGWVVSATATLEPVGATSEFSPWVAIDMQDGITLTDVAVRFGLHESGDLSDLIASDDNTYNVRSQFGFSVRQPYIVEVIIGGASPTTPAHFNLTLEMRLDNPGGSGKVQLRNWSTQQFEEVGTFAVGRTEQVFDFPNVDATNRVRANDGRIETSVFVGAAATFSAGGFVASFDQFAIAAD